MQDSMPHQPQRLHRTTRLLAPFDYDQSSAASARAWRSGVRLRCHDSMIRACRARAAHRHRESLGIDPS
ncbi:hypothetical protein [Burkholderia vietnamiensis]|uniref:hypothetical protein n=1 Tax=Burkholderia vietnamiensis TaxID=60552 RepID=UPI0018C6B060|nr:hypothetical protein [Burkholderia vietnamiensis]